MQNIAPYMLRKGTKRTGNSHNDIDIQKKRTVSKFLIVVCRVFVNPFVVVGLEPSIILYHVCHFDDKFAFFVFLAVFKRMFLLKNN